MEGARVEMRAAGEHDRLAIAQLFAAVAEERDGIAARANGELWDLIEMGLLL